MTCAAAVALLLMCGQASASAQTDLECLLEAVLAESTLSKEPFEADQAVAYSIVLRTLDGRFGKTICETINIRYARTAYKTVKVAVKKGKARLVRQAYTKYTCIYSYKCMPYYKGIVEKSAPSRVAQAKLVAEIQLAGGYEPPEELEDALYYMYPDMPYYKGIVEKSAPSRVAQAKLVAEIQLAGGYEPPEELEDALYYMYPEKSSTKGKFWFACVTKPRGRAHPQSKHVMFRDATDQEMDETLKQMPGCKKSIQYARDAKVRLATRKLVAEAK